MFKVFNNIFMGLKITCQVGGGDATFSQNYSMPVSIQIFGSKLVDDHLVFEYKFP